MLHKYRRAIPRRLHKFRQFLGENKTCHKLSLDLTNSRPKGIKISFSTTYDEHLVFPFYHTAYSKIRHGA